MAPAVSLALILSPNQAKHDAQGKTSSMKVCHLDRKGEISGRCEIYPRGARRYDKQTRITFEIEMELPGFGGKK